jgi:hypothetical protein
VVLDAIGQAPGKEADFKAIHKRTGLDRTTVWRSLGRLMYSRYVEPRLHKEGVAGKQIRATIWYGTPEPFEMSPSIVKFASQRRSARKQAERYLRVLGPKLLQDSEFMSLWAPIEVLFRMEYTIRKFRLSLREGTPAAAMIGKNPGEICENLKSALLNEQRDPFLAGFRGGQRLVLWFGTKRRIGQELDALIKRGILHFTPVYMLDISHRSFSNMIREHNRLRKQLEKPLEKRREAIEQRLLEEGKLKPKIVLPPLSK